MAKDKSRNFYFPFYYLDWLSNSDVRMMTHAERGLYIDMICRCYNDDGLPTDSDLLQWLFNCDEHLLNSVQHLFICVNNKLQHKRILEIKQQQAETSKKRSEAGKASGKSRAKSSKDNALDSGTSVEQVYEKTRTKTN